MSLDDKIVKQFDKVLNLRHRTLQGSVGTQATFSAETEMKIKTYVTCVVRFQQLGTLKLCVVGIMSLDYEIVKQFEFDKPLNLLHF